MKNKYQNIRMKPVIVDSRREMSMKKKWTIIIISWVQKEIKRKSHNIIIEHFEVKFLAKLTKPLPSFLSNFQLFMWTAKSRNKTVVKSESVEYANPLEITLTCEPGAIMAVWMNL